MIPRNSTALYMCLNLNVIPVGLCTQWVETCFGLAMVVSRGTMVNRTHGTHKKNYQVYIYLFFSDKNLVLFTMVPRNSVVYGAVSEGVTPPSPVNSMFSADEGERVRVCNTVFFVFFLFLGCCSFCSSQGGGPKNTKTCNTSCDTGINSGCDPLQNINTST